MENWGLITGRTSAFLLDPDRADQQAKKYVASVQSHEVAHMWYVVLIIKTSLDAALTM
jgi:aminopeptidase 2